jgi:hypothetical protein
LRPVLAYRGMHAGEWQDRAVESGQALIVLRRETAHLFGALSRRLAWRNIHWKACQSGRLQLALVGQLGYGPKSGPLRAFAFW